jgi:hypothetical protein
MYQSQGKPRAKKERDSHSGHRLSTSPADNAIVRIDPIIDRWLQELARIAVAVAARENLTKGNVNDEPIDT